MHIITIINSITVTKLQARMSRVRMKEILLFCTKSKPAPGAHLATGYRLSFLGMKGLRLKINYLSSSSAEVKNEWRYTSTPHIRFHCVERKMFMSII
jgi:hypothetical protein